MSLRAVEAQFPSRCTICDEAIEVGDEIVCLDDEWVHGQCAEDEGETIER